MTSKRGYAVAALALSVSLPLGACSQADSTEGEAKPKASKTAYPQPAYNATHEQLRAVAVAGQRLTDRSSSLPVTKESTSVGFCDDDYFGPRTRSWTSRDEVLAPGDGTPPVLAGNDSTQIGWTLNNVVVLDDSPSAAQAGDERLARWSTCQPTDDGPLTTQKVAVPGSAASVVRTEALKGASPWNAHHAAGTARVANVLLECSTYARTATLALSTTTSCLTEMVHAVPMAAGENVKLTDANRLVATKMLLARVAGKGQAVSVRSNAAASQPCETSTKTFMAVGTPNALLQTEVPNEVEDPATAETPRYLGVVSADRLGDSSAAKAKVAQARATFGGCKGSYTQGTGNYVSTGKVSGVTNAAFGDGGFTITANTQYPGRSKPETVQQSIFSVGPYVVELYGATPKDAAAIAARLKVVVGS